MTTVAEASEIARRYHERVRLVADQTGRAVVELRETLPSTEKFVTEAAWTYLVGRSKGEALGVLAARAALEVAIEGPSLIVVVPPHLEQPVGRMQKVLRRMTLDGGPTSELLLRLSLGEVSAAAGLGMLRQMEYDKRVIGYKRFLSPGACKLCTGWARDGEVQHGVMPRHPGCTCVMLPVLRKDDHGNRTADAA